MSRICEGLEIEQMETQALIPLDVHADTQSLNRVLSNVRRLGEEKQKEKGLLSGARPCHLIARQHL
jgi:hypothetical protein